MIKLISDQFALEKDNLHSFSEELTQEDSASRVFITLEIAGDNAKGIKTKIKSIFESSFFNEEEDLLLRFENCMKEVNEYLKDSEDEMSGIIAVQEKSELHISQTGKGEAYLIRKGKLNVIIENIEEEEEEEKFTSIASGELLVDDRIVFASLRLLRHATASQISSVLSEGIAEGVAALRDLLEIETQAGSVLCFHAKGSSIFSQEETHVPRSVRNNVLADISVYTEQVISFIAEKTKKPYDVVQNFVFGGAAALFILILISAVASASIDNQEKEKYELYKTEILKIEKELQIAETRSQMSEVDSANAILNKVESKVTAMLEEGVFTDEGLAIMERVQKQRDNANNIIRFSDMNQRVLADIAGKHEGEKVNGVVVLKDEVFAHTETGLFKTVLNHIEDKVVIDEADPIVKAEAIPDRESILVTLASGAMKELVGGVVSSAITTDEAGFKTAIAQAPYNRFVYFLVPGENQIYKYERKREGFTVPSEWLQEGIDLTGAIDLAIDGSIYVLKQEGGVTLFHKGSEIALSVQGGTSDLLTRATQIFVQTDMSNVYFFNPERNSVLKYEIINRGLKFQTEYVFETDAPLTDFYVDQNEQRLILSDENKLYEITL